MGLGFVGFESRGKGEVVEYLLRGIILWSLKT